MSILNERTFETNSNLQSALDELNVEINSIRSHEQAAQVLFNRTLPKYALALFTYFRSRQGDEMSYFACTGAGCYEDLDRKKIVVICRRKINGELKLVRIEFDTESLVTEQRRLEDAANLYREQ